jgi:hypothetical protein
MVEITHAAQPAEVPQELLAGHPVLQRELARQISHPLPDLHALLPDVHPEDPCPPVRRSQEAQERADGRRLARPVGPEKPEHFSFVDREVDAPDPPVLAVGLGKLLGLYGRAHSQAFIDDSKIVSAIERWREHLPLGQIPLRSSRRGKARNTLPRVTRRREA